MEPRALAQQAFDQHGAGLHQVLAIIDHQQHVALANGVDEDLEWRPGSMLQPERIEYVGRQELRLIQRRQFDPGHAMLEFTRGEGRDLGGKARLAAPSSAR